MVRVRWDLAPADWLPPAVLAGFGTWELWLSQDRIVRGPPWVVAAALAVASVALLWRRRRPMVVLLVVGVAILLPTLAWGTSYLSWGVFVLVLAVFACGRYAARPVAYLAVPLVSALVLVLAAFDPEQPGLADSWTWSLNSVWIFGIGAWIRQKQALVDRAEAAATERARAAVAEERLRIARDLHDVLAHSLAVMVVQAEAADAVLDRDRDIARASLAEVSDTGREALTEVRRVVGLLRDTPPRTPEEVKGPPGGLGDLPLLVNRMRSSGLPVSLDMTGHPHELPEPVGRATYRVAQEALTNVLRHAGPVPTRVRVRVDGTAVVLDVENDSGARASRGEQFGPAGSPGHGLLGMRERARSVGGIVITDTRPGGGFIVHAELPYAGEAR